MKRKLDSSEYSFDSQTNDHGESKIKEEKPEVSYKRDYSPEESTINRKESYRRQIPPENFPKNEFSPDDRNNRRKRNNPSDMHETLWKDEKKKEYMPVRTIVNVSNNVTEALN